MRRFSHIRPKYLQLAKDHEMNAHLHTGSRFQGADRKYDALVGPLQIVKCAQLCSKRTTFLCFFYCFASMHSSMNCKDAFVFCVCTGKRIFSEEGNCGLVREYRVWRLKKVVIFRWHWCAVLNLPAEIGLLSQSATVET